MPVTPEGWLSPPLHYLRKSLAASLRWQQLTESDSASEAESLVFIGAAPDDSVEDNPVRAIARYFDDQTAEQFGLNHWTSNGPILLTFEIRLTEGETPLVFEDEYIRLLNNVGVITQEMRALANTAGFLSMTSIQVGSRTGQAVEEEDGRRWLMVAEFAIGFRGLM